MFSCHSTAVSAGNVSRPCPQECACDKCCAVRGKSRQDEGRFGCGGAQIVHGPNAAMNARVAIDERADITFLRQEHPIFLNGLGQRGIASGVHGQFGGLGHIVAVCAQASHGLGDDVGVGQDAQAMQRRRPRLGGNAGEEGDFSISIPDFAFGITWLIVPARTDFGPRFNNPRPAPYTE